MAELPESIGNLKNLKEFHCYKNKLTGEYFIPSSPNETQYAVAEKLNTRISQSSRNQSGI